ncbi:MAG: MaoC family dehydratase N-terminal domain-containing protein [Proteobacteria bacterium]|nr:MaoC family dehydratase N-terminal domain-containing protein [Pseudomonadota bacterium]HQR02768.1 MaoC family dehydratase N-terminal domain-containing protein [Rhodocyclaceae bacterium]
MSAEADLFTLRIVDPAAVEASAQVWQNFLCAIADTHPRYRNDSSLPPICPPAMVTAWTRPDDGPVPDGETRTRPVELHHRLKEILGYPHALVEENELELHADVHPGDRIMVEQRLAELGPEEERRGRSGRRWAIELHYRNEDGDVVATERIRFFAYRT